MSKPDVDESTPMSYKHAKPTYLLVDGVSQRRLRCFGRPAHLPVVDAIGRWDVYVEVPPTPKGSGGQLLGLQRVRRNSTNHHF